MAVAAVDPQESFGKLSFVRIEMLVVVVVLLLLVFVLSPLLFAVHCCSPASTTTSYLVRCSSCLRAPYALNPTAEGVVDRPGVIVVQAASPQHIEDEQVLGEDCDR